MRRHQHLGRRHRGGVDHGGTVAAPHLVDEDAVHRLEGLGVGDHRQIIGRNLLRGFGSAHFQAPAPRLQRRRQDDRAIEDRIARTVQQRAYLLGAAEVAARGVVTV